ncbi:hypothetical protein BWI93_00665 [Siphonobacter sp. BAB-5385]|uniref:glycosyltransferase family 87 protein n=1 Tax=Siphonobacter sp. BAB-5385 TaxID=1864822 RepID=UPI000B9DF324|nr:glycosyltransferase family 87 protein [Siphonobacter sp. BAB-5385]OZI10066.1 hypothetical protein BWI93_00665 [Siphonobacter sp. BAB-5385]
MKSIKAFFSKEGTVLLSFLLLGGIIGLQHIFEGPKSYNNYLIFRQSFLHVLAGTNPYVEYPSEYFDIFLYHPSFTLFFSPFSYLPIWVGLIIWTVISSYVLFYAIRSLPITHSQKLFCWWFVFIELSFALHYQQTNPLITALGLLTFSNLENGKTGRAALFPLLAFCIKGYGLIFAALFVFYPRPGRYIASSIGWFLLLNLLPLPLLGWDRFLEVYQQWIACLQADYKVNYGFSVMGLLKLIWPAFQAVSTVQILGVLLLAATWSIYWLKSRVQPLNLTIRLSLLAYVLLWVILFNHAAEAQTYIIAVQGAALYILLEKERYPRWATLCTLLVFFLTVLSASDVYPPLWRRAFFYPYLIKVIPCTLVWFVLQFELISRGLQQRKHRISESQYRSPVL